MRSSESSSSDGSLLFAFDDHLKETVQGIYLYEAEHHINGFTREEYEKTCDLIFRQTEEQKVIKSKYINNKENFDKILAEIERRKTQNIEILKLYEFNV